MELRSLKVAFHHPSGLTEAISNSEKCMDEFWVFRPMYWVLKKEKEEKKERFVSNISNFQNVPERELFLVHYGTLSPFIYSTTPFRTPASLARDSAWFWTFQNVIATRTGHLSTTLTPT